MIQLELQYASKNSVWQLSLVSASENEEEDEEEDAYSDE
jgi:hypothetical protein